MSVGAIIVAAGTSKRAGFDKVFAALEGRPVLAHSLETLARAPSVDRIVLVLAHFNLHLGEQLARSRDWGRPVTVCLGGQRRQDSVAAGLAALGATTWVLVHDAARPLVTVGMVERGLEAARETGAAIAAVPAVDTIKVVDAGRRVVATPDRASLWAVQTPQVFRYDLLADAYRAGGGEVTDDATLLERRGHVVKVYEGEPDNIKITLPGDLELAAFLLERRRCRAQG